MSEKSKKKIQCKLILVGDSGVGKTCIINRYLKRSTLNVAATLSTSWYTKYEEIKNYELAFQIWDTVGQEQYRSLNTLFFKDAHICLFVFDITRKESFSNIKNYWYESIITNGPEGIVCGIAGNKNDLSEHEKVDRDEVKEFCDEINAIFKYTSAKNNICIDELFKELGYKFLHSEFMKDMSLSLSSISDSKDNKFLIKEKNKRKKLKMENIGCC